MINWTRDSTPRIVASAFLATAALLFDGCSFGQSKKAAEAVLTQHFQAVATNGFDTAIADYGTEFFQNTTKDEWTKALSGISRVTGQLKTGQWRALQNRPL